MKRSTPHFSHYRKITIKSTKIRLLQVSINIENVLCSFSQMKIITHLDPLPLNLSYILAAFEESLKNVLFKTQNALVIFRYMGY